MPLLRKSLNDMYLSCELQKTYVGETCYKRKYTVEFSVLTGQNMKNWFIDWKNMDEYKEMCQLCSLTPNPKGVTPEDIAQFSENKELLQKLKQSSPLDYKRLRNTAAVYSVQKTFAEEKPSVNAPSDWFLATVRFQIEGKMYPLTQYLTWLSRVAGRGSNNTAESMTQNSAVSMLHQDPLLIDSMLHAIAKIFKNTILIDHKNVKSLIAHVALFQYEFAHAMPFSRGSAAVSEWFERAIFMYHGFDVSYNQKKMVNLEALSTPANEFVSNYSSMITLKALETLL
jgi:hypothetical protein